jgi:acyl-CoA thioester hydrolase
MTEKAASIAEWTTSPIRVTYRDTDRMGHVYYANYFVWMEQGRTDLLRSLGRSYREWEDDEQIFIPVSSCWADFKMPAQYDDLIEVQTRVCRLTRATITFEYDIFRQSDRTLLARGGTTHPFVDKDGKIKRIADKLLPTLIK